MNEYDWLGIGLNILSVVGGSSIVAALLPVKYRIYLPLVSKIIDAVAANVGSAKNATPQQITEQKVSDAWKKANRHGRKGK